MNLLVPAALAFAIIIPIILLFYFMRPKRQERMIGSTLLWQQTLQDLQASRPWQRLRITPLLLLQLLAALIVVFVLARPAILTSSQISGDTIIILQASASMQATDIIPTRFDEAKNQIAALIDTLGPSDQLSLLTMARTPQVLLANSQDKNQLMAALQHAQVTNQDADLEQALSLATSLAAGHSNAQVIVIGDGHVLPPDQQLAFPFPVRYLRIGTNAPNVALQALAARTIQGNLTAQAQLANYSPQTRAIPVALYADGQLVTVQTLSLPAGAIGTLQWTALAPSTHLLHAHVLSQDAMSVDHDAWAIVGASMHGRVLLVTNGNTFLQAALRLQSNIDLYETTPAKYTTLTGYDLTIFDGFVPPTLPDGGLLFFNPPTGTYPFGKVGPALSISSITIGNDPANLLANVDLSNIHALRASHQITPTLWAQAIINSPETPLLVAGEQQNQRIAVFGFDLHDTDLPLQPTFPILMFNLMNWFLPSPVAGNGQLAAGTPVTIQTWPGADQVIITSPNHHTITLAPPFPVMPFDQTNQTGIYRVAQRVHGQERYGDFVVNLFDPLQSRLLPAQTLPVIASSNMTTSSNGVPRTLHEIWPWIAALLLLVLSLEWWIFSKGYKKNEAASTRTNQLFGGLVLVEAIQKRLALPYRQQAKRFQRWTKRVRKQFKPSKNRG